MKRIDNDLQFIVDGNTPKIKPISYNRNHSICSGVADLELTALGATYEVETWKEVEVYEDGIKKGTYYVSNRSRSNDDTYTLICQDATKRLDEYYYPDVAEVTTETSSKYWIQFFLDEAGVSYNFTDPSDGEPIQAGSSFGPDSVSSIILPLLNMNGWYLYCNPNGVATIGSISFNPSSPDHSINEEDILSINVSKNDETSRNRILVWNTANGAFAEAKTNTDWMSHANDYRTVVIANQYIRNSYHASKIAGQLLGTFRGLQVVKTIEVHGADNYRIGQTVRVRSEAWSGMGVITSLSVNMSSNGLITTLVLDEACPRLIGTYEFNGYVYIATMGNGVWRKLLEGNVWEDYSAGLTDLTILDLHVNNGAFVCVSNDGYAYIRDITDSYWRKLYHGSFSDTENTYTEAQIKASACIFNRTDSIAHITYWYAEGGVYRSWVATFDLFGTKLSSTQILTVDSENYIAYDIDRNENNNFISAYIPEEVGFADPGFVHKNIHHECLTKDSGVSNHYGPQIVHNPDIDPIDANTAVVSSYKYGGGTFINSNWVLNDDEVFLFDGAFACIRFINFSRYPAIERSISIGVSGFGADGYAYLWRTENPYIFQLAIVRKDLDSGNNWSIQHSEIKLTATTVDDLTVYDGLEYVTTYDKVRITDNIPLGGLNRFLWAHPVMLNGKVISYWVDNIYVREGIAPEYYVFVYNMSTATYTTHNLADYLADYADINGGVHASTSGGIAALGQISARYAGIALNGDRIYQTYMPVIYRDKDKTALILMQYNTNTNEASATVHSELGLGVDETGNYQYGYYPSDNQGGFVDYWGYNETQNRIYYFYNYTKLNTKSTFTYYRQRASVFSIGTTVDVEWVRDMESVRDGFGPLIGDIDRSYVDDLTSMDWIISVERETQPVFKNRIDHQYIVEATIDPILNPSAYRCELAVEVQGPYDRAIVKTQDSLNYRIYFIVQDSPTEKYLYGVNNNTGEIVSKVINWPWASRYHIQKPALYGKYFISTISDNAQNDRRSSEIALINADAWLVPSFSNRVLKQNGSFEAVYEKSYPLLVELSDQDPLTIYTPSGYYIPGEPILSTTYEGALVSLDTQASSFFFEELSVINMGAKVCNIYNIEQFPELEFGGAYLFTTSGTSVYMRDAYFYEPSIYPVGSEFYYGSPPIQLATFSGFPDKLETSKLSDPPFLFTNVVTLSGTDTWPSGITQSGEGFSQVFMQRSPDDLTFYESSLNLPTSRISVIRVDDSI